MDDKDAKTRQNSLVDDDSAVYDLSDPDDVDASSGQFASSDERDGTKADQAPATPEKAKADQAPAPPEKAKSAEKPRRQAASRPIVEGKAYGAHDRRTPSQKDVLERLLEKNEVILQLTKKNVDLETTVKDLENKRLRTAAEFENYRKRTRKEWELLKDQTKAEVLGEVLNVADDFERAFATLGDQDDDFVQGIRLIYNNLMSTLEGFGIKRMESLGELFDPNFHMAVATIESRDVKSNHIVEVIQEGYLLDDSVVRAAKVVIAK